MLSARVVPGIGIPSGIITSNQTIVTTWDRIPPHLQNEQSKIKYNEAANGQNNVKVKVQIITQILTNTNCVPSA